VARDEAVCGGPVDIREVDELLALFGDRHVRDDRVDRSVL
jgi:hypothetical protein